MTCILFLMGLSQDKDLKISAWTEIVSNQIDLEIMRDLYHNLRDNTRMYMKKCQYGYSRHTLLSARDLSFTKLLILFVANTLIQRWNMTHTIFEHWHHNRYKLSPKCIIIQEKDAPNNSITKHDQFIVNLKLINPMIRYLINIELRRGKMKLSKKHIKRYNLNYHLTIKKAQTTMTIWMNRFFIRFYSVQTASHQFFIVYLINKWQANHCSFYQWNYISITHR